MANQSNNQSSNGGETPYFLVVTATSAIVGLLILFQLFRGRPIDLVTSLIISVCFVVAVVVTAMWSNLSGERSKE